MKMNANHKEQAVRYLLGELTEVEQSQLEERFFQDAELSELLSEVEDDLIDQYVREEFSATARKQFEQHFLISERRREKIEFARALLQAEKATQTAETEAGKFAQTQKPLSWWKAILSPAQRPALAYALAAVAVLVVLGGVWLFSEVRQLRKEIAQMEAEQQLRAQQEEELRHQASQQSRQNDALAAQNEKLEQELALLKQQADITNNESRLTPPLTFLLAPSSRNREAPKSLTVPRSVEMVRLQLNLNAGDQYPAYRVKLQTASGEPIRSWDRISASSQRGQRIVFVTVPAKLLQAGQYELALSGLAAPDRLDDLGFYYFNLRKE